MKMFDRIKRFNNKIKDDKMKIRDATMKKEVT